MHIRPLRTLARHARIHTSPLRPRTPIPVPTSTLRLHSPLPVTPSCPPPSCPCSDPPPNLDIDRTTPLLGTMPRYHRHLLISTGKSDWASRIEFDPDHSLAGLVRSVSAQGLRDPFAPLLITNSSFETEGEGHAAYVFPAGLYIPSVPATREAVAAMIKTYLLPGVGGSAGVPFEVRRVMETVVLICSHMSRDTRCGTVAPGLKAQFEKVLGERGVQGVRVGFTSHLSGHKFAGNVVVYLPSRKEGEVGVGVGVGVWYGRVEPRHVEGIVDETVIGGRVVGELCRGVVGGERETGE